MTSERASSIGSWRPRGRHQANRRLFARAEIIRSGTVPLLYAADDGAGLHLHGSAYSEQVVDRWRTDTPFDLRNELPSQPRLDRDGLLGHSGLEPSISQFSAKHTVTVRVDRAAVCEVNFTFGFGPLADWTGVTEFQKRVDAVRLWDNMVLAPPMIGVGAIPHLGHVRWSVRPAGRVSPSGIPRLARLGADFTRGCRVDSGREGRRCRRRPADLCRALRNDDRHDRRVLPVAHRGPCSRMDRPEAADVGFQRSGEAAQGVQLHRRGPVSILPVLFVMRSSA